MVDVLSIAVVIRALYNSRFIVSIQCFNVA